MGRKPKYGLNRRGLLLLGMGLRDSEVAKSVRRMLLGTFEHAEATYHAQAVEIDYAKLAAAIVEVSVFHDASDPHEPAHWTIAAAAHWED